MGQIRVKKSLWDKLDRKTQEMRKVPHNGTFLNEPVLDEVTQEYVWDDHRIISEHEFIKDECLAIKPKVSDTEVTLFSKMEQKLYERIRQPRANELVKVTEEQVSPELTLRPR